MEDQVPFKVYTFWSIESKPEVRRFGVDKSMVTSFHYLTAKLQDLFPGLRQKTYTVSWKDEDDDDVAVSSDEEMLIALSQVTQGMVKLNVFVKDSNSDDSKEDDECDFLTAAFGDVSAAAAQAGVGLSGVPHAGVVCDSCDGPVIGFRYKCATCPDYDLCSRCEAAGLHADHCMIRVPMPQMPRHLIKAAIKRSRHFLKTVAVATEECPYKKHKREKSGERKPHRREHRGRPRASWLDTFATYINEFANLAGDVDCHPPTGDAKTGDVKTGDVKTSDVKTADAKTVDAKPGDVTQTQEQSTSTEQASGEKSDATGGGPQKPQIQFDKLLNPDNVKYLLDLQKTLTDILIPNLVPEMPKATSSASASNDVEMGQGDRKEAMSDKVSVKSESSTSSEKDTDKADGWTVINKEHDLMDSGAKPTPSAPEQTTPIGFNLAEEFERRINIAPSPSTSGNSAAAVSLYPPLYAPTAVLDPIREVTPAQATPAPAQATPAPAPAQATPAPAPAQPKPAPAPAQPKPNPTQPQPRPRHPKAHIEAAIEHMLAMGFNNDSGWLTQLLETKDGNISAVLDLLTPAKK